MTAWCAARHAALLLVVAGAAGCSSLNHLDRFDFRDRTVVVVSDAPAQPDVLTGPHFLMWMSGNPVRDFVRAGARVIREVEAQALRERLVEASSQVDVAAAMEDQVLERGARYLGARPGDEEEEADFVLEVIVVEYGIDAESWDAAAHFYIEADATVIHAESGEEVWHREIGAREAIGPHIFGNRWGVRDAVTAIMLADLSVEEIVVALESLADFSAYQISDRLREDLREARRR